MKDLGLLDGLAQMSFVVSSALARVADRHDLSIVQMRLLGILRDREPAMMELATALELDKSSVTGLVGRAEKRGLVRRTSTSDDRRAVHVTLTEKGRKLVEKVAKQGEGELGVIVEGMSETDRKRLAALATQIVEGDARRRGSSIDEDR